MSEVDKTEGRMEEEGRGMEEKRKVEMNKGRVEKERREVGSRDGK